MPKPRRKAVRSNSKSSRPASRGRGGIRAQGGAEIGDKPRNGGPNGSAPVRTGREQPKASRRARPRPVANMLDMEETLRARELFWANVVREILCSLAEASQQAAAARASLEQARQPPPVTPEALMAAPPPGEQPGPTGPPEPVHPDVLDGRICVITTFGDRIPIAEVKPLFAMGVDKSPETRALSMAVECSVFQILTPKGMVYTVPIHEIRAVRAVSEELMTEIEHERGGENGPEHPFGFAAFTSMARSGIPGEELRLAPPEDESNWE
ncbi:MAG: hypothetical protein IT436_16420 [Phycisphaerales bacterium]|nr:hypothetical protein [Phycisphaerales bacterium]